MRIEPTRGQEPMGVTMESEAITLTQAMTSDQVVVSAAGAFSACDVWFYGPDSWMGATDNVVVRVFGRQGGARVLMGETSLRDAQRSDDGHGQSSAWVLSVRGAPVEGFEVTCRRTAGTSDLDAGYFMLCASSRADRATLSASGGIAAARAVTLSGAAVVTQSSASALQATVSQPSASALQATVSQPSASALQATVSQSNASSLQATVSQATASALQSTAAQGAPAAHANRWPVILSDGANAQGTTTNPLFTQHAHEQRATFAAVAGPVATGTAAAVKSIAYLWHPSTSTKRVEIRRILVAYAAGGTTGHALIRGIKITAEAGSPGGSTVTPTALDGADSTSLQVRTAPTNAPTRLTSSDAFAFVIGGASSGSYEWVAGKHGKPIVLRASTNEGIEIAVDIRAALGTQWQVTASFEWTEV